jgi:hypothetical protein
MEGVPNRVFRERRWPSHGRKRRLEFGSGTVKIDTMFKVAKESQGRQTLWIPDMIISQHDKLMSYSI